MNRRDSLKYLLGCAVLFSTNLNAKNLFSENVVQPTDISELKDYLFKMSQPDVVHKTDLFVKKSEEKIFKLIAKKLFEIQNKIGFGNFTQIGFKELFKITDFTLDEKNYLEKMFKFNAKLYGFYGEKVIDDMFQDFNNKKFTKVDGIYILDGSPVKKYKNIVDEIGSSVYITSGIRNIPKQCLLFMNKTLECNYNLSMASRTLAPIGYSYHGIGDFDIGKRGLGEKNFTDLFAETNEFKLAVEKGFIDLRYDRNNLLGVRFEPWHIKV